LEEWIERFGRRNEGWWSNFDIDTYCKSTGFNLLIITNQQLHYVRNSGSQVFVLLYNDRGVHWTAFDIKTLIVINPVYQRVIKCDE